MVINYKAADQFLENIAQSGRQMLFEHEVYQLFSLVGIGQVPRWRLIPERQNARQALKELGGDRVVMKIVHPRVIHKTDVGGVRIVNKREVDDTLSFFFGQFHQNLATELISKRDLPSTLCHLSRKALIDILTQECQGVLVCENIFADGRLLTEFMWGMRMTHEFGPVSTLGLGGVNVELFNKELQKGGNFWVTSPLLEGNEFSHDDSSKTLAYRVLRGELRCGHEMVSATDLERFLGQLRDLVNHYSQVNPDACCWFSEFEINPFVIQKGRFVLLDGFLTFERPKIVSVRSSKEKIHNLLNPNSACVIGVSSKDMNMGRIILGNLRKGKFSKATLAVVKPGEKRIDGVSCFSSIEQLPQKYDLVVVTTAARKVVGVIDQLVRADKVESIVLISAGMGEKEGGQESENEIKRTLENIHKVKKSGPVLLGGNSLGLISRPGEVNTMFIPENKLPRCHDVLLGQNVAMISQSGAFAITRMSKLSNCVPRYLITTGNQVDLEVSDFLEYMIEDDDVKTVACYVEGFGEGGGSRFALAAKELWKKGKDVIIYKAGRRSEGKTAAMGHTAAMTGDDNIARSILRQCGCLIADTFEEWTSLVKLSSLLSGCSKRQRRLGAISNAGFEAVGMADHLGGLSLAKLSEHTQQKIFVVLQKHGLDALQDVRNPMDLTPMATDAAHVDVLRVFLEASEVDLLVHACVPLTPAIKTYPDDSSKEKEAQGELSYIHFLLDLAQAGLPKPLIVVVDSGPRYDSMAQDLEKAGIPVFRSADTAIQVLGKWVRV